MIPCYKMFCVPFAYLIVDTLIIFGSNHNLCIHTIRKFVTNKNILSNRFPFISVHLPVYTVRYPGCTARNTIGLSFNRIQFIPYGIQGVQKEIPSVYHLIGFSLAFIQSIFTSGRRTTVRVLVESGHMA
jgi:hypothetical protein